MRSDSTPPGAGRRAGYGDAPLPQVAVGSSPGTDWTRTARVIEPQPDPAGTYETLFETYLSLYPATRELVGRLSEPMTRGIIQ